MLILHGLENHFLDFVDGKEIFQLMEIFNADLLIGLIQSLREIFAPIELLFEVFLEIELFVNVVPIIQSCRSKNSIRGFSTDVRRVTPEDDRDEQPTRRVDQEREKHSKINESESS